MNSPALLFINLSARCTVKQSRPFRIKLYEGSTRNELKEFTACSVDDMATKYKRVVIDHAKRVTFSLAKVSLEAWPDYSASQYSE